MAASVDGTKIYVADLSNQRVRLIDTSNGGCVVSTLGGGGTAGYADGAGTNAKFNTMREITFSALGDAYVGDYNNNAVRKVTASTGVTTTVAGGAGISQAGYKDGTGTQALFNGPRSVVMLLDGSIYVADSFNHMVRKILTSGIVVTVAGGNGVNPNQVAQPVTVPNGWLDGVGTATLFHGPSSITADANNNIFVLDNGNFRVRKITPLGVVSTIAGNGNGAPLNLVPLNYPAGSALIGMGATMGSNNGVGTAAQLFYARGVTGDSRGNLYISDSGNRLIRRVDATTKAVTYFAGTPPPAQPLVGGFLGGQNQGVQGRADSVYPLAATFFSTYGIVCDATDTNLYVVDSNSVRRIALNSYAAGAVTTIAGSTTGASGFADSAVGTSALFSGPRGIAIDAAGTFLYVADYTNNRIRAISLTAGATYGAVTTIAGGATAAFIDATGTSARFSGPSGLTVDPLSGALFVADTVNLRVRRIVLATGAVTTWVGSGVLGQYADGVGTSAYLNSE